MKSILMKPVFFFSVLSLSAPVFAAGHDNNDETVSGGNVGNGSTGPGERTLTENPSCLFGSDLVDLARKRDLDFSKETKWKDGKKFSEIEKAQMKKAFSGSETPSVADDYGAVLVRQIKSHSNKKDYTLLLASSGGNYVGGIFEAGTSNMVAEIGDASIVNCTVDFDNYKSLPWFYSN